jgi:glycosyltransferase involved in cell wall biosynthesis
MKPSGLDLRATFSDWFDRAAARHIPPDTEIYVGWSSKSEDGIARAQEGGATTIVERGSAHIEVQRDLLRKEYEQFGGTPNLPHPEIVEKEKREYEAADYIGVPSSFVKRTFLEEGVSESKLIQVPYGVDLDGFSPVKKEDDTFRVIYAGSMSLRKGVHYLLRAFAELDLPGAELWLLGSKRSEVAPFFKRYEDAFQHLGHKPQEELYRYYSQGSVFVLPSIEEGLAMVQVQAMACGLPLICSTNTGGEDLINEEEHGFVVPIRDVDALKGKIRWCYENQGKCREMGQSAHRRVQEHFTWSEYGKKITYQYKNRVL